MPQAGDGVFSTLDAARGRPESGEEFLAERLARESPGEHREHR